MTAKNSISPNEVADRLAMRQLIDAYAHCADRRDAKGQMALFTTDAIFEVFMDSRSTEPTQTLRGRDALAPVFANLNSYRTTTHFNGQSTVEIEGNEAKGESYCLAHHLTVDGEKRTLMVASIRYLDTFSREGGTWLFAERKLMVDWTDTRSSVA
jgi:ketosteroid isomerase-like protein